MLNLLDSLPGHGIHILFTAVLRYYYILTARNLAPLFNKFFNAFFIWPWHSHFGTFVVHKKTYCYLHAMGVISFNIVLAGLLGVAQVYTIPNRLLPLRR